MGDRGFSFDRTLSMGDRNLSTISSTRHAGDGEVSEEPELLFADGPLPLTSSLRSLSNLSIEDSNLNLPFGFSGLGKTKPVNPSNLT